MALMSLISAIVSALYIDKENANISKDEVPGKQIKLASHIRKKKNPVGYCIGMYSTLITIADMHIKRTYRYGSTY